MNKKLESLKTLIGKRRSMLPLGGKVSTVVNAVSLVKDVVAPVVESAAHKAEEAVAESAKAVVSEEISKVAESATAVVAEGASKVAETAKAAIGEAVANVESAVKENVSLETLASSEKSKKHRNKKQSV